MFLGTRANIFLNNHISHISGIQSKQITYSKMPKHKKRDITSPAQAADMAANKSGNNEPVKISANGDLIITILAKPGAKHNTITGLSPEGVGVQISAPPREGEANIELCRYLANVLGVKKTAVSLDKGSKSRNKVVQVCGTKLTIEAASEKLKQEMDNG